MKSINQRLKPRKPARKNGMLHRLRAMTETRKVPMHGAHVLESSDPDVTEEKKIARNLIVLVAIHVLAISMWLIYESRQSDVPKVVVAPSAQPVRLEPNELSHNVQRGETYAQIAMQYGLSEKEMRDANRNVGLSAGLQLRIPPRKIVADLPQEVRELKSGEPVGTQLPLTSALPSPGGLEHPGIINKPMLVKPRVPVAIPVNEKALPSSGGVMHRVEKGENIYQIAKRYHVNVETLMKQNGISDPRKLQIGDTLQVAK